MDMMGGSFNTNGREEKCIPIKFSVGERLGKRTLGKASDRGDIKPDLVQ
jgi:hypothetical protein